MFTGEIAATDRLGIELFGDIILRFGRAKVRVTGSSMMPSIWPGDVLTVERRPVGQLQDGEIVVFTREGRLFAHRVIAHGDRHLVTRGDTVPSSDAPVSEAELLGVVVLASRRGRSRKVATHL